MLATGISPATSAGEPAREEQDRWISENLDLAHNLAGPWMKGFRRFAEDIRATAELALVKAARSYRAGRGMQMKTWAFGAIQRAIVDYLRTEMPFGYRRKAGDAPKVLSGYGDRDRSLDPDPHGDAMRARVEAHDWAEWLIGTLEDPQHRDILTLIFVEGLNQREVAERIGMSTSNVSRIYLCSLESMTQTLQESEETDDAAGDPTQ